VLSYAVAQGHIAINPAVGMAEHLTSRDSTTIKPLPAIHWKQLPAFLQAIDDSDMFAQTELALRFLMLTFVRSSELRYAKWEEFDMEKRLWTIPAERMKMKKEHYVPLSTQALDLLEQLKVFAGDSEYVLPGRITGKKPISENTILFAIYRIGYKDQMTAHGCRALASTWLNEEGMFQFNKQPRAFNPDAIERQLAHGEPNKVRDVYNRADYLGEREIMMQTWADFLDQQADQTGKVVPIRGKAS
jgi:integrase